MLNAEALKADDSNAMAAISKGLIAHKVKVVSWSNRNRKSLRKKGKGSLDSPTTAQDSQFSLLAARDTEDAVFSPQAPVLGQKDLQEANALVDQLKKLLSK
jgi:hypothetical protein